MVASCLLLSVLAAGAVLFLHEISSTGNAKRISNCFMKFVWGNKSNYLQTFLVALQAELLKIVPNLRIQSRLIMSTTAYSNPPLAKKLCIKPGYRIRLINA